MTIPEFRRFLIETKMQVQAMERNAIGAAKSALGIRLQTFDEILVFLNTSMTEEDMGKLRLTLLKTPLPLEALKPREANPELTEAIIELAHEIAPGGEYPLDNLPKGTDPHSVKAKIYAMRTEGVIPKTVFPAIRTITSEAQAQKYHVAWPGHPFVSVHMTRRKDKEKQEAK